MFTAEVQFTIPGSVDNAEDLIHSLLAPWRKHGQVLSQDWAFVKKGNRYRTNVMIFDKDSLDAKYDNKYAQKARREFALQIKILGEDPFSADICHCKKSSFYILYTNYICLESPLRCGDCFGPLPLYEIPAMESKSGELHDQINSWRSHYQSCDSLQMGCSVGEKFGTREMSLHDSNLSQQGIAICTDITKATAISTYYYLYRYNSRSRASEIKRKCPSCGGDWLLDEPLHDLFDFKCDRCRLLSNIAFSIR
jgi:predicted  nucleic acid-binding Zn ribbon protein